MADDVMDSFAEAVSVVTRVGVNPLVRPRQAAAVVADVVADPLRSTADDFSAFRAALYHLAAEQQVAPTFDNGQSDGLRAGASVDLHALADGAQVHPELVGRHLDALARQLGLAPPLLDGDSPPVEPDATGARISPIVGSAAAAAVVIVGGLTYWAFRPASPSPIASTSTEIVISDSSSSTSAPEQQSLSAVFPTVREGPFEVTRSWKVTETQLAGVIIVERVEPGGGDEQRLHTELIPALAVSASPEDLNSVRWNPDPPTLQIGLAARFEVGQLEEGEAVEIQFFGPLREGGPVAESEVNDWYEAWVEEFAGFRNPLGEGDEERYDSLIGPSVTEE